jgi:hypothetical protein
VWHTELRLFVFVMKRSPSFRQRRLLQQVNVPRHGPTPSRNAILGWLRKSEDTGSVTDIAQELCTLKEMFGEQGKLLSVVHAALLGNNHAS